jgi:amidase
MFAIPSEADVQAAAASIGLHLSSDDVTAYRAAIIEQLTRMDTFLQSRLEESHLPLLVPQRDPGHRPSADEDPYNAWLWKCDISAGGDGPLAGLTVSFKDCIPVAGIPLTLGSYLMDGYIPDFDASVVTRSLAAGARVIGKNALNGFTSGKGLGGISDYGAVRNPHDPQRIPGSSSSGSAAAVAAGEVDVAFGADVGGSVRVPAAYCGVVGLKATAGLIPNTGLVVNTDLGLSYIGPIARRVEHVAAALEAVAGYDGFDAYQSRAVPDTFEVMNRLDEPIRGLRIGLLEEGFGPGTDPAVRDGVMAAVDTLAGLGATVTKVRVPEHLKVNAVASAANVVGSRAVRDTTVFGAWAPTHYPVGLVTTINKLWAYQSDLMAPRIMLNFLVADFARRNFHGAVYAKAQNVRPAFIAAYDDALKEVDVLALPTCQSTAPAIPERDSTDVAGSLAAELKVLRTVNGPSTASTRPFNYTGHPAIAIPCGKSGGLPYSLQLVGRFFEDVTLLRAAYAYQCAVEWDQLISIDS